MTTATVGALRVVLGLDSAAFADGLTAAQRHLREAGSKMQSVGATIATAGAGMSAAITAPFIALGAHLLQGSQDAAAAAAQVEAALTSMGGASGKTAEQLSKTAEELRNLTGVDDDEILTKVTANLLTFGNVAGDVFDRAQRSILDISARMGGDLQSATMMVGKALNDPIKGLAALRRVGIQFTEQQEEQIKAMQGVGDVAGAQAIMLGELERQFGGAAEAAGRADIWKPLKTALMDLEGAFEPIVRDVIGPLIARVADLARAFASASPGVQQFAVVAAAVAAAMGPVMVAAGGLVTVLGALLPVIGTIGAPFLAFAAAAAAVGTALFVFRDDLIPIIQSFAASVQENIGPKLMPLWDALVGAVRAVGEVFIAILGDGSPESAAATLKAFGEVVSRIFGAAVDLITGAVNIITNILRALAALLRGDFSTMWNALGSAVQALVTGVLNAFETLFPGVIGSVQKLVEGVTTWLRERLGHVLGWVIGKVREVGDAFFKLYDAVVGHSYIPDMVEAIADWMGPRLQRAMVNPAIDATATTGAAFEGLAGDVDSQMDGLLRSIASKDWKGALGGVLDILGGQGGKFGGWAKIGGDILKHLPGFKTGGSFRVGGSGGADSSLVAFRATPGEMVDVRRPGQIAESSRGGDTYHFQGNLLTPEFMRMIDTKIAQEGASVRGDVPRMAVSAVADARQRRLIP